MTIDFQWEVFRFIMQSKEGRQYIEFLEKDIFDLPEHQVTFHAVKQYFSQYKRVPSKPNFIEFVDRELQRINASKELKTKMYNTLKNIYIGFENDTKLIKDTIIQFAQYKKTKNMFKNYSSKIADGEHVLSQINREMNNIIKLGQDIGEKETSKGGMLLADHFKAKTKKIIGHPTYLNSLNLMTASNGFYSPQLIIFMGAPKSFKTGNLLKMAVEYVRDGYKVYYIDVENGVDSIRNRAKQAMMSCTRQELYMEEIQKVLDEMVIKYKKMGGDMQMDFYPSHSRSIADVEAQLEYLKEEHNWVPDIICWDYPDNMLCNDYTKRKERRLNIQHVYFDIINLNNKWGCFSIGVSQVNRNAVNKTVINMTDFSEDFGKAMNCHAAFAICRTEEEMEGGTARIIPVVQRDGVAYKGVNQCLIEIEESRMYIKESNFSDGAKRIKERNLIKDE